VCAAVCCSCRVVTGTLVPSHKRCAIRKHDVMTVRAEGKLVSLLAIG
jgi:hypothetical protein